MSDRQNTIICIFDPVSPRISAYQIHEWIYEQLHLPEQDVRMVQIDGPRRRVYLKFTDNERVHTVLRATNGKSEFRHDNGKNPKCKSNSPEWARGALESQTSRRRYPTAVSAQRSRNTAT